MLKENAKEKRKPKFKHSHHADKIKRGGEGRRRKGNEKKEEEEEEEREEEEEKDTSVIELYFLSRKSLRLNFTVTLTPTNWT